MSKQATTISFPSVLDLLCKRFFWVLFPHVIPSRPRFSSRKGLAGFLAALRQSPALELQFNGQGVVVSWREHRFGAVEIQVNRGDGKGFALLCMVSGLEFIDPMPLPAGVAVWKYRGIYRRGNARAGCWSQPALITVAGLTE